MFVIGVAIFTAASALAAMSTSMGGVAPAKQGYYLVEGQLLPRLDVIGHAERVAWSSLVERLVAITKGETPRIE